MENNDSNMKQIDIPKKHDIGNYTMNQYFTYNMLIILIIATAWILGKNDHDTIKWWFVLIMPLLLIVRIPDFVKKQYHHFLVEMCYYVNVVSVGFILFGFDIRYVFSFLHGPLMMYSIFAGDAFVPHDLSKTTSFAVHTFGTVVSRRLYWTSGATNILSYDDLTYDSFTHYLLWGAIMYLCWILPYSFYLLSYKGTSLTMIRYTLKIKESESISTFRKLKYLFSHIVSTFCTLSLGIVLMHIWQLDYIMVFIQLLSGLIQGGWHYYSQGHRLNFYKMMTQYLVSGKRQKID